MNRGRWGALLLASALTWPGSAGAERLPLKRYTTADGLPHDRIKCVVRDSQGFLWFCTVEGLSRFDGYGFTNYTESDGLANASANDIIEDGPGRYWVATNGGGLCLLDAATAACRPYPVGGTLRTNRVNVVHKDRSGAVWAGSDAGLFRMLASESAFQPLELGATAGPQPYVRALLEDEGGLWIGTGAGLFRATREGIAIVWPREGRPPERVGALARDPGGRLWIGAGADLIVWIPSSAPLVPLGRPWHGDLDLPRAPGRAHRYRGSAGDVDALHASGRGELWVGAGGANLTVFDGRRFQSYPSPYGVEHVSPVAIGEDDAGNVWVGTAASGAIKVARNGFVSYDYLDGLNGDWVVSIFDDLRGALYVVTRPGVINRLDGARFVAVRPMVPLDVGTARLGRGDLVLADRSGDWWLRSTTGAYRFTEAVRLERLATAPPVAHYRRRDGLPADHVSRFFEDARGDVWIGTMPGADGQVLSRWERATGRLSGFPLPTRHPPGRPRARSRRTPRADSGWRSWREAWSASAAVGWSRWTCSRRRRSWSRCTGTAPDGCGSPRRREAWCASTTRPTSGQACGSTRKRRVSAATTSPVSPRIAGAASTWERWRVSTASIPPLTASSTTRPRTASRRTR